MRWRLVGGGIALLAAATCISAERVRPVDPDLVVLQLPRRATEDVVNRYERLHAASPDDPEIVAVLAQHYIQRARTEREPRYFGRAEALLTPWMARENTPSRLLDIQADILQNRHAFPEALSLLDHAAARDPRDINSRLSRAAILMVQGDFVRARLDCVSLVSLGETQLGSICLAQVLGSTGMLARAEDMIDVTVKRDASLDREVRVWALSTLAEFADRRGDLALAEERLREALELAPESDAVRTALADVLLEKGEARQAMAVVDVPRPQVGLLVRRAWAQTILRDASRRATLQSIDELLQIAERRGERIHLREEALLAWVLADHPRALDLARRNFAIQREVIDARVLARASAAASDREGLKQVADWQQRLGFEDHVLETTLLQAGVS